MRLQKELKLNLYPIHMKNNEFFVPYIEGSLGPTTRRFLKRFVLVVLGIVVVGAFLFSFFQNPFKNSTFELSTETKVTGTFHQSPYPMLRVQLANNHYKNIVLLGFGKSSANPYLEELILSDQLVDGSVLSIEGNLIYYNGKTLLQITSDEKIKLTELEGNVPQTSKLGGVSLEGEIIDPKCYFGVMKPGFGKIHRSCAIRCISGGIPPVFVSRDQENNPQYYLLTDMSGAPLHKEILHHVGKPSQITGDLEKLEDWQLLKIDVKSIVGLSEKSAIYE